MKSALLYKWLKWFGVAGFCFLISSTLHTQTHSGTGGRASLEQFIKNLSQQDGLRGAGIGISVKYADNGMLITEYNSKQALATASVMKLVTTATAWLALGETFRFITQLQYDGEVVNGVLHGNLYIRGGGDPTLGSDKFNETQLEKLLPAIVHVIQQKGIKTIKGDIIADDALFETSMSPATWNWGDLGNYYGAGASALSIFDNLYYIYFNSGNQPGDTTHLVKIEPEIPGLELVNEVISGKKGSGDNAYVFGSEYTYLRYVRGTIPAGENNFSIKGSIPDPPFYAAWLLKKYLLEQGIEILGKPTTTRLLKMQRQPVLELSERKELGEIKSPSLMSIIQQTNIYSNNLYAEHLHKALGVKFYGKGSNYNGNEAIKQFWIKRGLNADGFIIADGSGLSRSNAVSADNLTSLLIQLPKEIGFEKFYQTLPVAGKSGTMRNIGKGTVLENNLRAKSGSMNLIRAYAGYVKNPKGREIAFAILFNNFTCEPKEIKEIIETLMIRIAGIE
ncbi:MAG: D-alanyl-D-alanine carboxypeptidase/D-alanyl-D-alanine-endopeptidase [Flavobacteriales bacterium]|nr:D-alanyl-D-alanine carboxypeptidase/D-alanyl-D-alanine-endopeptidase [Flavobacteriales bacterium]